MSRNGLASLVFLLFKNLHGLGTRWFVADRSGAVVLLWFSVACFWCRNFGDNLHYVCSCCELLAAAFSAVAAHSVSRVSSLCLGSLWFKLFPVLVGGLGLGSVLCVPFTFTGCPSPDNPTQQQNVPGRCKEVLHYRYSIGNLRQVWCHKLMFVGHFYAHKTHNTR